MALLRLRSPFDALSCMSEELHLQVEDALRREKQEEVIVRSHISSYVLLILLYALEHPDLPMLRSTSCRFACPLLPFRAGTHPLRPTRQKNISLSCSFRANRVRHVLRSANVSSPCTIRLEESTSGQVFGCLRTLRAYSGPHRTATALA